MDKREFLLSHGWSPWYNENYWVHPKTITDPTRQDYTDYGLSLDKACEYELNPDSKPFKAGESVFAMLDSLSSRGDK